MEWIQFFIVVITIGSFLWMARSDYRHLDAKIDSMRNLIDAIREDGRNSREAAAKESKDFHDRLCNIEERRGK